MPKTQQSGLPTSKQILVFVNSSPTPAGKRESNKLANRAAILEAARKCFLKLGYEIHASTPEDYAAFMKSEIARWAPIAKAAGIKVD